SRVPEEERLTAAQRQRGTARRRAMSKLEAAMCGSDDARADGNVTTFSAADVLYLAAAPTFAIMALVTGLPGGSADAVCAAMGTSSLGGMMPMYLLMSAFHLAPWLKLLAGRRSGASRF